MSNKVIFLDIDGVLNSNKFVDSLGDAWTGDQIDPLAVNRLNKIVKATGAKVVISSTWRILMKLSDIRGIIKEAGGEISIIDKTPRLFGERGHEIQAWLDENPAYDKFVILDDNADMAHLLPYLVQTIENDGYEDGLQDEHVEAAIAV